MSPSATAPHRTAQPRSAQPQRIRAPPPPPTATPRQPEPPQAHHPHVAAPIHQLSHQPDRFPQASAHHPFTPQRSGTAPDCAAAVTACAAARSAAASSASPPCALLLRPLRANAPLRVARSTTSAHRRMHHISAASRTASAGTQHADVATLHLAPATPRALSRKAVHALLSPAAHHPPPDRPPAPCRHCTAARRSLSAPLASRYTAPARAAHAQRAHLTPLHVGKPRSRRLKRFSRRISHRHVKRYSRRRRTPPLPMNHCAQARCGPCTSACAAMSSRAERLRNDAGACAAETPLSHKPPATPSAMRPA